MSNLQNLANLTNLTVLDVSFCGDLSREVRGLTKLKNLKKIYISERNDAVVGNMLSVVPEVVRVQERSNFFMEDMLSRESGTVLGYFLVRTWF